MIEIPKKWRVGAIGLAAAAAVAVPAVAFAYTGPSSSTGTPRSSAPAAANAGGAFGALAGSLGTDAHGGPRVDLDTLAAELGVTPEALQAALDSVKASVTRPAPGTDRAGYQAAVVSALAQALGIDVATVQAAADAHGLPSGGHGRGDGGEKIGTLATTLGVTTDALHAALNDAKSSVARPADGGDFAAYRTAIAGAVANTLGLDVATVEAALGDRESFFGGRGHRDGGARLDGVATTLGVTTDALHAALDTAKTSVERPAQGGDLAAYRAAIATSVASSLGLDAATVETALGDAGTHFGGRGHRAPGSTPETSDSDDGSSGVGGFRAARGQSV